MTFKDILYWSRTMTYKQLNRLFIRCVINDRFKAAEALNSMIWLNYFKRTNPHTKIRAWMYALQAYKFYKTPR